MQYIPQLIVISLFAAEIIHAWKYNGKEIQRTHSFYDDTRYWIIHLLLYSAGGTFKTVSLMEYILIAVVGFSLYISYDAHGKIQTETPNPKSLIKPVLAWNILLCLTGFYDGFMNLI